LYELLGVPTLASGTGYNESTIAHNLLELWKHNNKVQVGLLGFDTTTSVNISCFNRVYVLLEDKVGRELLWLACRRQVMELILARIFTLYCDPCNSPFTAIFKRVKAAWGGMTWQYWKSYPAVKPSTK